MIRSVLVGGSSLGSKFGVLESAGLPFVGCRPIFKPKQSAHRHETCYCPAVRTVLSTLRRVQKASTSPDVNPGANIKIKPESASAAGLFDPARYVGVGSNNLESLGISEPYQGPQGACKFFNLGPVAAKKQYNFFTAEHGL